MELKQRIEKIWEDRSLLQSPESQELIRAVVEKIRQRGIACSRACCVWLAG